MKFVNIFLVSVALIGTSSAFSVYKPVCPPDSELIFFPHDYDCSKFYTCYSGTLEEISCPEGLHFNPEVNVCDYPEQAGCENLSTVSTDEPTTDYTTTEKSTTEERTTEESTTEEWTTPACRDSMMSLAPHKSDCTKFYLNIRGRSYEVQCNDGKMFDSKAEDCVMMSTRGC